MEHLLLGLCALDSAHRDPGIKGVPPLSPWNTLCSHLAPGKSHCWSARSSPECGVPTGIPLCLPPGPWESVIHQSGPLESSLSAWPCVPAWILRRLP